MSCEDAALLQSEGGVWSQTVGGSLHNNRNASKQPCFRRWVRLSRRQSEDLCTRPVCSSPPAACPPQHARPSQDKAPCCHKNHLQRSGASKDRCSGQWDTLGRMPLDAPCTRPLCQRPNGCCSAACGPKSRSVNQMAADLDTSRGLGLKTHTCTQGANEKTLVRTGPDQAMPQARR